MTDYKTLEEEAETCETLSEAINQARTADPDGNGIGCTIPFRVEYERVVISVVEKYTQTRPKYYLFTVDYRHTFPASPEAVTELSCSSNTLSTARKNIEQALGLSEYDVSVDLEPHGDSLTAIVPAAVLP